MEKIICPECGKEILSQADIELPTSTMEKTPSARITLEDEIWGTSPASLLYKDGEYFLILETLCVCPSCKKTFVLDIPLKLADWEKIQRA
jgi:quinolinate synthase